MRTILLLIISFSFISIKAQLSLGTSYMKRIEKNKISMIDSTNLYFGDGESKELFYYALVPKDKIKGTLILLPSVWESVESVFNNNKKLCELACDSSMLIIVPSINYNIALNQVALSFLNTSFSDVLKRYNPPKSKFVIGGFSLGGINAIRYVEAAYESDSSTTIKPAAVYGVDPPLDWANTYSIFERTIALNFSVPAVNEAKDFLYKMNTEFGGSPKSFPEKYNEYSAYSRSMIDGGKAKYLLTVPIRIYCDPDIDWWMKNRQADYYDMNALDQTAMINQLQMKGNHKAEFVNALGKGYRLNGQRHPHSWSIAEPVDCLNWMLKNLSR
jgi:hypothetical protein